MLQGESIMPGSIKMQKWKEQIRVEILNGTKLDWPFLLMNILAATIASYGLLANSPAIIIGAMIVAMLLGPITGVALALVDSNLKLLRQGLTTILVKVSNTAPILKKNSPWANKMLAAHKGGTRAVAMATPTKATLKRGEIVA